VQALSTAAGSIRFDGQVAVVTGAGSGLGRGYALDLAARGASVVCNDLVERAANDTARQIVELGGAAVAETSSVASPEGGAAIVQTAIDAFGSVEIVINNAGQLRNGAFEDLSVDDFRAVLDTHLFGAFFVTQPAYRHMQAAGYGRIVFTSSSAGMFGSPWQASYGAAKAGIVGLCNVVALEGAAHGIISNAIMPMALTGIGEAGPPPYSPEQLRETVRALQPLAPSMTVKNVTPLVLYLSSRACAETRRIFSVGCGRIARVAIAESRGWSAPGLAEITLEQVVEHLGEACDLADFGVPESIVDEANFISDRLRRST
jgi:NAD(P)-dependent dehydrogenase (short-subunit alcohol dehydrogenase family)